jgi:MFS family permease
LGKWSDRIGRKKVLLVSNIGTFIGWIIFLVALLVPVWPIHNIDSQVASSFVITLPLIILFFSKRDRRNYRRKHISCKRNLADVSIDKDRSKNFGKMAISSNLGFIIGPVLAGILGATIYKEILPVMAAVIVSLITVIVIIFKLQESRTIEASSIVKAIPDEPEIRKVFQSYAKIVSKFRIPKIQNSRCF